MEERRLLSGGALDPTFGTGGIVTSLAGWNGSPFAIATYPQAGTANDSKIVVGGFDYSHSVKAQAAIIRYNVDGSLDKSFGGTGEVFASSMWRVRALALQPDGKVLAAGTTGSEFAVIRYNADGSLDKTFGSRGLVTTSIVNGEDEIWAMELQADGKIVVAGGTTPQISPRGTLSTTRELALVRYNANGTLDTSFGKGGEALDHLAISELISGNALGMGMAIDPATGTILVQAPNTANLAMVVRYTASGKLDTTFGDPAVGSGRTGYETLTSLHSSAAVAIQPSDHRIVVAGGYYGGVEALERLNIDGTPDMTFGTGGLVATNILASGPQSVKIQADGRIVVGATGRSVASTGPSIPEFMVTRFNQADGSLDPSFGVNGVAQVPAATFPSGSLFRGMALEPDGRIVVAATPEAVGSAPFVVARFLATGPQIGSFSANAASVTVGDSVTLTAANIADGIPNGAIAQVAFYVDSDGDGKLDANTDTLLGYAIQTSPGVWTLTFTVNLAPGKYTFFAQAEDNYGVLGDPFAITETVS
jgi:uncharacterized delta-60 repeat protein